MQYHAFIFFKWAPLLVSLYSICMSYNSGYTTIWAVAQAFTVFAQFCTFITQSYAPFFVQSRTFPKSKYIQGIETVQIWSKYYYGKQCVIGLDQAEIRLTKPLLNHLGHSIIWLFLHLNFLILRNWKKGKMSTSIYRCYL